MIVVQQSAEVLAVSPDPLLLIERAGRTCYKSENKITEESAAEFVKMIMKRGHESVLEHGSATIKFITDRGVTHELVRHRIASFSQESTRYCNYGNSDEISVIEPLDLPTDKAWREWSHACRSAEKSYLVMLEEGASPQWARTVLPNSLKTEIITTANFREWRHIFKLRFVGTAGAPHPQIKGLMEEALIQMKKLVPVIFDDII